MKEQNIDVAIITAPANVFYYTGFNSDPHERFMALVLDNRNQRLSLFVPALDEQIATDESFVKNIIPISDEEDPFTKLKNELGATFQHFGLEMKTVSMFRHNQLKNVFPDASYSDIQPLINKQRLKKSREEIVYLQEAVTIIENVLNEGIKKVKVGMTEAELAAELEYLMKNLVLLAHLFLLLFLPVKKLRYHMGDQENVHLRKVTIY